MRIPFTLHGNVLLVGVSPEAFAILVIHHVWLKFFFIHWSFLHWSM